jgi:hypothetical protein
MSKMNARTQRAAGRAADVFAPENADPAVLARYSTYIIVDECE